MKATTAGLARNANALRQASTKTVKEGTYYCADSHRTGFALGMVTMLFVLSLINVFSPFITGLNESSALAASVTPWLLGVAFAYKCLESYPYFMNGTDSDGDLYDDVRPEPVNK